MSFKTDKEIRRSSIVFNATVGLIGFWFACGLVIILLWSRKEKSVHVPVVSYETNTSHITNIVNDRLAGSIRPMIHQAWEQGFMFGATYGMIYHTNTAVVLDG